MEHQQDGARRHLDAAMAGCCPPDHPALAPRPGPVEAVLRPVGKLWEVGAGGQTDFVVPLVGLGGLAALCRQLDGGLIEQDVGRTGTVVALSTARLSAMLLAIDIGNTQTLVGLYALADDDLDRAAPDGNRLVAPSRAEAGLVDHWRIATNADRTSDEQVLVLQEFLAFHGFSFDEHIDGIVISSVVPRSTAAFREMTERYFGFRPVVIEAGVKTGMPILTENPREVGADRIANAVGTLDLVGGPVIVIDFGTAHTFDALSAKGEFLGGVIAPGVDISLDALYTRTAALRRVELVEPRNVVGRTTVESIQAGAIYGFAGQVDGICGRLADELGTTNVVATGGLAELIAPYTRSITRVEPWLTLHGLRLVFDRNA